MSNFRKVISLGAVAILGATNLLAPLSYANAATDAIPYDELTGNNLTSPALRFIMPNHNVTLYAITAANKYFVLYNGNTHTSGTMGSGTFTYDTTGNLAPNAFVKTGYTWSEWNAKAGGNGTHYASGATVFNWTTEENGEIEIYAQWNPNTYTIDYDLNKGSATSTPSHGTSHPTTATYDSGFTVNHPSMQGYTFSGWTISNMDTEEHTIGTGTSHATSANGVMATSFENLRATSGIVQFLATWSRNQNTTYKVEHYLEKLEGGYPASPEATDNLTGPTDTEVTPSVKTYEGFTANSANTPKSGNINPDGNKVFRYEYTRNPYNLTLNAGRGVASVRGSGSVTAPDSTTETTVITFKYDEPVTLNFTLKSGYTGGAWTGYSGAASSFNMPAESIEKTAIATPITYTIEIDYNDGTAINSVNYNVETSGSTLAEPIGVNSTFLGWTGGVVDGAQLSGITPSVTISQGSTGNRKYYAVWQCLEGYHPSDDRAGNNYGNCVADGNTEYTVQHLFQNLEGTNYVHSGAIDEHKSGETATTTNETGNVYPGFEVDHVDQTVINGAGTGVAKVYYNRLSYTGTIHKDTGVLTATGDGANSPVGGPYKYGDTVTLTATTGAGYVFDGWTVTDASGDTVTVTNHSELTATFVMPASTVTINADAHTQPYTISYNLNSGTVVGTNPTSYTVETPDITLINPTRDHSVFLGWTGTDHSALFSGATVAVSQGSIGNREFVANWGCMPGYHASGTTECVANTYKVIAEDTDGTHGSADAVTFTYDQTGSLPDAPSQSGYDFVGWTITGLSGGVEHYIGDVVVTSDGTYVYSGTSTEFKNLTVENGGTVTVEAIWSARNDTKYIVNHYIKNVGTNTYTLSGTVERSGTTDTAVNFSDVDKEFFGFTYSGGYVNEGGTTRPEGAGVTTGNIAKDESTVINLYYDRNILKVTLSGDAHVASLTWTGDRSFEYGATVNVSATAKTGYHFVRWEATPTPGS